MAPVLKPPAQFFDMLGPQAGVWLWTLDPASGRLDIYSDLAPILGEHPTDFANLTTFVHPEDQVDLQQDIARVLAQGGSSQRECRLRGRDGGWAHFHVSYCAGVGPKGQVSLYGVSRDVTQLVAARQKAEEAMRLARLAEGLAGIGYWRYTAEAGFTWSDQMYAIYGLDPAKGPPPLEALPDYCHPEDREKHREHQRRYSGREAPSLEVRIVRPDGEIRHVLSRNTVERNEKGEIVARFGTLQDVTEIKRAEATARELEQRYRFIAEHASDMIVRVSPMGELRFVSPGSRRVFGYEPEEVMAMTAQQMTHPDDLGRVAEYITRIMQQRAPHLAEPLRYRARHKDGSWVWIESNPSVIFDELTGEPIESIDIIRNITQAKAAEEELREARRRAEDAVAAKAAFLANMSHELRTPLTSITGFARLMEDQADLPEAARHFTMRIRDASEALLSIINDVLDFSKLEARQVELEQQPFDLGRLVEDTVSLLSVQAASMEVALVTELDPSAPALVMGDAGRLRQVLLNLLSNAVKFTCAGQVTVRTRFDAGAEKLRIEVMDTGPGISAEAVGRLFERFSQADVSINRTHGGTGLGLAISKGIIELMGGQIGVETELGRGSTFWFEVPAAAAAEALKPEAIQSAAECPPMRLLVVDDTAVNRELVRLMLEPLGLRIQEAGGGAEAVQAAMDEPFDIILMDVRMPGVDGLEATRVIRGASIANRSTPILGLTADVQPENAAACLEAGMNDVLAKPINPRQLVSSLVRWGTQDQDPAVSERAAG
jgi:PAS domain S-box-containing protein